VVNYFDWSVFLTYNIKEVEVWMKTIGASQFKEQCLSLLEKVDREGIIITKHGQPIAKLIPISTQSATLIGSLKGKIRIKGDILSSGSKWNAES
jgi:prevent-host-death family protein